MFNPRGNMPPRPRGPNAPGSIPRGPFQGPGPGPDGLQRQHPNPSHRMPQRFMGPEMRPEFPRPNVQVAQHRMDPRQGGERMNMERQQKEEGCATHWDNPFPPGNISRGQPTSGRIAEHTTKVQNRYTNESASSILASFGLSNEDLEELSRYPDDQLTPENMPLILRDIRMRKMVHQLPNLPAQSREKETFHTDDGHVSMVKSKVIDYGHESKYGYAEGPLEVKVYNSDVPSEENMKGFQAQQTASVTAAPSTVTSKQMNAVEELIRQMGFQRSTPNTQSFFPMDTSNKMPGLRLPSAGAGVPPAVQPMMPPVVPPMPQSVMPPVVQQALPPPSVPQPIMPPMNQPPPPFLPEMLGGVNRHDRIHHESRANPPNAPPGPTSGQKKFQKEAENPIESPFGVVKASWLPVFSQADAQKMKRLPTPSMMNDYYAASPRIFPHMCSLCNVECRHLKDWIQHQNSTAHLENCRQLRQQYPDWNPESHSSSKRREGDRKENHTPRRRSASFSPKRSRRSSSGHARRRTRSRSRSPRYRRTSRPRSRSPRRLPSPRHRSRSPRRPPNFRSHFRRSFSRERAPRRSTRSPDKDLEAVVKCLGPHFVEQFNKQKSSHALSRETSGTKRTPPEPGKTLGSVKKPSSSPTVPPKPSKPPYHGPSDKTAKPPETADGSNKGGTLSEGKNKKTPVGAPAKEANISQPIPWLLTKKAWSCGTVLRISDLPGDGFSDHDIKKIVQPFGKVSDILVLHSKNEAFLEMNYKEAVIAAVKYGETVPVLVNGRRVKISVAGKPKAPPKQCLNDGKVPGRPKTSPSLIPTISQADVPQCHPPELVLKVKGDVKKVVQKVKKSPLRTKKEQTKPAANPDKSAAPVTSASKTNVKDPGKTQNSGKTKASVKQKKVVEKKVADTKKPGATKTAIKPKKSADSRKSEEAKKASKSKKATEPKKTVESKAKETNKRTAVPDTTEAVKSTEASELVTKEAEEMCVVVISSLPEAGLTLDEISNLTKPFGLVKDVLIVSSHKKAYVEISRKSADSMVKFYNCFPMWVEKNQLCITLVPEFKGLTNEEAIFIAMIKDVNPTVITEALHAQFVHLGNLPDGGYSELEILCVGLRFGRVDHYMVITNKNKAILQLDSAESAASMCRFLKRYPYSLGESQLTFSRSPKIEPLTAEVTRKENKKQEPSKESPDLKTISEGSGVVQPSAVPSAKPIEAKEEPSSNLKAKVPEVEAEHMDTEKMVCAVVSKPLKTEVTEEDSGVGTITTPTIPVDLESSEIKSEEVLALPSELEKEEKVTENSNAEILGNVSTCTGVNASEESATPADESSEVLHSMAQTGSADADSSMTVEGEDLSAVVPEAVAPDSAEGLVEELSGGDTLSNNKLITPESDSTEASGNVAEMPAAQGGVVIDLESENPFPTVESSMEVESEATAVETKEATKKKPELQMATAQATLEKQPEGQVPNDGAVKEEKPENNANEESPEQILPKAQPSKGQGLAETDESCKTSRLTAESAPSVEATSVSQNILKALLSVPNIARPRAATRRKEEQKTTTKPVTRSRAGAENKSVSKEASQQRPANRTNAPDSSKSKQNISSVVVELGSGKSSSQQDKDSQVEIKGSPKPTPRERENRSSSMKRDNGSNKVSSGRNTRSSKNITKPKEEEELSPFNLDEFLTMDEVTDEVDSPSQPRRNPARGKRKDLEKKAPHEPSSKRKKGKTSAAHVAENELSFVTLDEIGEDEGGMSLAELTNFEAMPDPLAFVTVDEVNEEEELIDEVIKDPQSLVTLDEISEPEEPAVHAEQEDPAAKDAFTSGDNEPDLKAEPLVTVDEIGEVEELPLNEPSHFKDEETLKPPREDEEHVVEDCGDFLSSQMPDDPSTLVTVDEIHEDSDDQPLVTLDEVTEDDEDFLEEFNRLKEDLNFVTVDEVGSEDEEEGENETYTSRNVEELDAKTEDDEETIMPVAELEDDGASSADVEEIGIPDGTSLDERVEAWDDLLKGKEIINAQMEDPEKKGLAAEAAEINRQETTLVDKEKDEAGKDLEKISKTIEGGEDLEKTCKTTEEQEDLEKTSKAIEGGGDLEKSIEGGDNLEKASDTTEGEDLENTSKATEEGENLEKESKTPEGGGDVEKESKTTAAETGSEHPLAEAAESYEEGAEATEMEVEGSPVSTLKKDKTGDDVLMTCTDIVSVAMGNSQVAVAEELDTGSELPPQNPDLLPDANSESCSEAAPSQSSEKPEKDLTSSECEEPESKRRKADSSEKPKPSSHLKDLDFLVPKAGFFCQICSCFCVNEAFMKTHCQSQPHQKNMEKFMVKKAAEEEKTESGEDAEELSST